MKADALPSACPKCQKQVAIPDGAEPESRVRCPLCDAEYALSEALALAPPALILIDAEADAAIFAAITAERRLMSLFRR